MDFWTIDTGKEIGLEGKRILLSEEQLKRHTIILGKTGTGKSYLLTQLIDLLTGLKRLIIFDLHGELWKYRNSNSDIIALRPYIDEKQGYLKFNMMGVMSYRNEFEKLMNEDLTIQSLKDIFSKEETYSQGTWGPRIELVFTVLPKLLFRYKVNPTLEDLLQILLDPYERRDFLSQIENGDKMKYYSIFNSQGYDFISSTVNKLMPILSNDLSRAAFASKFDSIDFSKLKRDLYIVLSPEFSSSLVTKQFSIMLLYKIWNNLIMGRLKNTAIVIDEFQILTPYIAERFLTEGRKFGLNLIAATQTTSLLNQRINGIIRTNVSNVITFKGSNEELNEAIGELKNLNTEHEFQWIDTLNSMFFKGKLRVLKREERDFQLSEEYYSFDDVKEINENSWKDPYMVHILSTMNLVRLDGDHIIPTEEFMKAIGSRGVKGRESIYHRYLITRAYLFFKSKGYRVYENIMINGGTPDLIVIMDDKEMPVECEYSDLKYRNRIIEKANKYEDVIFVTFQGYEDRIPENSKLLLIPPIGDNGEIKTINFEI